MSCARYLKLSVHLIGPLVPQVRVLCHYFTHFATPLSTSLVLLTSALPYRSSVIRHERLSGARLRRTRSAVSTCVLSADTPCIYKPWCERWMHDLRLRFVNRFLCFMLPSTNLEDSTFLNSSPCTSSVKGELKSNEWILADHRRQVFQFYSWSWMKSLWHNMLRWFLSPLPGSISRIHDPWSSTLRLQPSQSYRMSVDVSPEVYIESQGLQWVSSRHASAQDVYPPHQVHKSLYSDIRARYVYYFQLLSSNEVIKMLSVIWIYDYLDSLPREILLVWCNQLSITSIMFFINRYIFFVYLFARLGSTTGFYTSVNMWVYSRYAHTEYADTE